MYRQLDTLGLGVILVLYGPLGRSQGMYWGYTRGGTGAGVDNGLKGDICATMFAWVPYGIYML